MKITLFTSSKQRHNYLINLLSTVSKKIYVIQELDEEAKKIIPSKYSNNKLMQKYFDEVKKAQTKYFGDTQIDLSSEKIKIQKISSGSLNSYSKDFFSEFLNSDVYIVFGSGYIKGELVKFLIDNKALNIHMGISPYYRGTDCNFWALYDDNPHLVGATIHLLSEDLDDGPILYHAMSKIKLNPFEYTMSTVKAAFYSLVEKIKNKSIFDIKPIARDITKEIRFSKKSQFNEEILKNYFLKTIDLKKKEFDLSLLKSPYFLER